MTISAQFPIMELLRSWKHPEEVYALLRYKLGTGGEALFNNNNNKNSMNCTSCQLKKCYEYLDKTSRSFASVIRALDDELRDAVCIFYLVLRALDTVEDDMTIPHDEKVTLLEKFYTFLQDPTWNYTKSKEKDRIVLEDFTTISSQFRLLKPIFRDVISDICRQMGNGMIVYLTKSPDSIKEWNEYCHYVAGLVGIGLSQLFSASNLEDKLVGNDSNLSNSMGLFLQKTNIIRDYLEDVMQGRHFWPKEVWSQYSRKLIELSEPERIGDSIRCLNELITNALLHIPDVIKYLSRIQNQSNFNFCAIPQVMAMATLERCYNNGQVFRGIVKIRKGEAIRLMMQASNLDSVKAIFTHYLKQIEDRIPSSDPSAHDTRLVIEAALSKCDTSQVYRSSTSVYLPVYLSLALLIMATIYCYTEQTHTAHYK